MKVRTNLSSKQLEKVAKGLEELSKKASDVFVAENEIEDRLDSELEENYKIMLSSVAKDLSKIIKE